MKKNTIIVLLLSIFSFSFAQDDRSTYNVNKIGDNLPEFTFTTLDGKTANIKDYEGKTILLNFFATWCPPCMKELPELQEQIWEGIEDENFVVLTIGRGHDAKELKKWNEKKGFTFPICPDKDKAIYEKFFTKYIPRNVVISKEGKIILQETGYSEEGFEHLIETIKEDLEN